MSTTNPARHGASSNPLWSHGDTPPRPARRGPWRDPDPMMICPICEEAFRATGMTWLGAFEVADMTDDGVHEMAVALVEWQDRVSAQARRQPGSRGL